jgi:plastocyanin
MRHRRLLLLTLVVGLAAAACSSAEAGWTYAPAPSPTPVPSGAASGAPSSAPSTQASSPASGAPSSAPSASTSGAVVTITAQGIAFTTHEVTAPSGGFTLAFDNEDNGVPHDVQIKDASGSKVFETEIFPGVATRQYQVPALQPGAYTFACTVHSNMTGMLTVQ